MENLTKEEWKEYKSKRNERMKQNPIKVSTPEEVMNLKVDQWFKLICVRCGESFICRVASKSKLKDYATMMCGNCRLSLYRKAHPELMLKTRRKTKEKYGVEFYAQTESFKTTMRSLIHDHPEWCEKAMESNRSHNGGVLNLQTEEFRVQSKQIKKEKYGDETYTNPEKTCETKLERYGDPYYNNTEKRIETCNNLYGKDSYMETDEFREKSKEKCLDKFGVEYYLQSENYSDKMKNVFGTSRSRAVKYIYSDGTMFDSSWELMIWIYAKDHNEDISREPRGLRFTYDGSVHYYYPDFLYNGKLIEIKGDHFFENGHMCNPYDRLEDGLYDAKYRCGLKNGVEFWNEKECEPYIKYVNDTYGEDYISKYRV